MSTRCHRTICDKVLLCKLKHQQFRFTPPLADIKYFKCVYNKLVLGARIEFGYMRSASL